MAVVLVAFYWVEQYLCVCYEYNYIFQVSKFWQSAWCSLTLTQPQCALCKHTQQKHWLIEFIFTRNTHLNHISRDQNISIRRIFVTAAHHFHLRMVFRKQPYFQSLTHTPRLEIENVEMVFWLVEIRRISLAYGIFNAEKMPLIRLRFFLVETNRKKNSSTFDNNSFIAQFTTFQKPILRITTTSRIIRINKYVIFFGSFRPLNFISFWIAYTLRNAITVAIYFCCLCVCRISVIAPIISLFPNRCVDCFLQTGAWSLEYRSHYVISQQNTQREVNHFDRAISFYIMYTLSAAARSS